MNSLPVRVIDHIIPFPERFLQSKSDRTYFTSEDGVKYQVFSLGANTLYISDDGKRFILKRFDISFFCASKKDDGSITYALSVFTHTNTTLYKNILNFIWILEQRYKVEDLIDIRRYIESNMIGIVTSNQRGDKVTNIYPVDNQTQLILTLNSKERKWQEHLEINSPGLCKIVV